MQYQDDRVTEDSINNGREEARLRNPGFLKSVGMSFAETATEVPRLAFNIEKKVFGMDFQAAANVLPDFKMNLAKAGADFSLSEMANTVPQLGQDITAALHGLPANNPLDDTFEVFNKALDTPYESWTQKGADFFASIFGYINPINDIGLMKPAFSLAEGVSSGIAHRLPAAATAVSRTPIRNFGGKLSAKTYGEVGEHLTKAMFAGTAVTAPGAMLDNYDKRTDSFNIAGAAEQALSNGFLSIAIDALPVVAGLKFGKHKKTFGKEYENPMPGDTHRSEEFDTARENNEITDEDHKWIKSYIDGSKSPQELKETGIKHLLKDGYNVDHAQQKVIINMIKESHFNDFQSSMMDQISSGANEEFKTSLSDYVSASGIDFFKSENSKFIDGLNGYVDFMDKRLAKEPENLKAFSKARKSADLEHIDASHEMSQSNILKYLKNIDHDQAQLPHGIPKNLRYRALQERKITKLKRDITRFKKLSKKDASYESKIDKASNDLRELKSSLQKHLTPNQELKELEQHFLGEKGLPENYQISHDYHRLVDLAHVSPKAEALLQHVKLKNEYDTQNAYKDFMKYMNSIIESNVEKYADPDKVVNYFKSRAEKVGNYPGEKPKAPSDFTKTIETGSRETTDRESRHELTDDKRDAKIDFNQHEEILKANEIDIDAADSKEISSRYKMTVERFNQFKENDDSLSQMVSCDMNSIGVNANA